MSLIFGLYKKELKEKCTTSWDNELKISSEIIILYVYNVLSVLFTAIHYFSCYKFAGLF